MAFNLGVHFIPPTTSILSLGGFSPIQIALKNIFLSLMGYNTDQQNPDILPVILGHIPAGCAVDQLFHYGQLIKTGRFQQCDHDFFKNEHSSEVTGSSQSQDYKDYNLKNVKIPVALYYSG